MTDAVEQQERKKQLMLRRLELLIAACLYYSGLVNLACWWTQRSGQRLVILCYHHTAGGHLRQHLLYLSRHYRVLHLEAALEELYVNLFRMPITLMSKQAKLRTLCGKGDEQRDNDTLNKSDSARTSQDDGTER